MAINEPNGSPVLNIFVFGCIGNWWGLNKSEVLRSLKGKRYSQINLVISSNGGDLSEALVIRDLLKAYPATVTTYLTGLCASAATILADAGDKVVMSMSCIYMVHKPLFEFTYGNADDLRKDAKILDEWENIAVDVYRSRTGLPENDIRSLMTEESWLGPFEALDLGFIDEITDVLDIDFEIDAAGLRQEDMFLHEPIYFQQEQKEVYSNVVAASLKSGYRQISPATMQAIKKDNKKEFDMKEVFKSIVAMLVTAGIIPADKKDQAIEAANGMETPEMIASIVREEVAKQQKAPSMKATDVVGLIEAASTEEKAKLAEMLGFKPFDDTELKANLQDLSGKVATLIVGEGGGAISNGGDGFTPKDKRAELTYTQKEHAKMYLEALESGSIDPATYKSLTGNEAPKRERQN